MSFVPLVVVKATTSFPLKDKMSESAAPLEITRVPAVGQSALHLVRAVALLEHLVDEHAMREVPATVA